MVSMFTGPDEVERCRERIWGVPFDGSTNEGSRVFITANPSQCNHCSSVFFPVTEECIVLSSKAII